MDAIAENPTTKSPKAGDYRLATNGKTFCVQRFIDRTIWPLTAEGNPRWCQVSWPASQAKATETLHALRASPEYWRPVE